MLAFAPQVKSGATLACSTPKFETRSKKETTKCTERRGGNHVSRKTPTAGRAVVFANDLNPHAATFLRENAALNQVPEESFYVYNLDGADFVRWIAEKGVMPDHVIMNLPGE